MLGLYLLHNKFTQWTFGHPICTEQAAEQFIKLIEREGGVEPPIS
jgi:hypothetical protein